MNDIEDLWCKVLRGKYKRAEEDGRFTATGADSSLWKDIVRVIHEMLDIGA